MKSKIKSLVIVILIFLMVLIFISFNRKQNVNKLFPSVVHIESKNDKTTTVGSGIVYEFNSNNLYIITNYHIVKGYSIINIYDKDLNQERAKLINFDEEKDIAILSIRNRLNVRKANFDIKSNISEKDEVYVFTSFIGQDKSYIVKNALVSKTNELIMLNDKKFNVIKLSYDIENGDSGSPIINKKGKVIGMLFLKDKKVLNCGYALPIDFVLKEAQKMINTNLKGLNLGALMTNSTNSALLEEYDIEESNRAGVVILSIKEKYPLSNSGIVKGDLIVEFDNEEIKNVNDLQKVLSKHKKGDKTNIKYYRNNKLLENTITLTK